MTVAQRTEAKPNFGGPEKHIRMLFALLCLRLSADENKIKKRRAMSDQNYNKNVFIIKQFVSGSLEDTILDFYLLIPFTVKQRDTGGAELADIIRCQKMIRTFR